MAISVTIISIKKWVKEDFFLDDQCVNTRVKRLHASFFDKKGGYDFQYI